MVNEEKNLESQKEMSNEEIKNLIYTIRGKQVMLDSDVAMLYHYTTKNINKAVKRNIERFPEDFCFQLTKSEMDKMWFQNGTTSKGENNKYRSEKYLPYVFNEQGISMLSGQVFERLTNMEYKLLEQDKKFDIVFNQLQQEENIKQKIFFDGQIYDSYSLIIDTIKKANKKIVIIDNYIDDSVLKMLTKKNKNVEKV